MIVFSAILLKRFKLLKACLARDLHWKCRHLFWWPDTRVQASTMRRMMEDRGRCGRGPQGHGPSQVVVFPIANNCITKLSLEKDNEMGPCPPKVLDPPLVHEANIYIPSCLRCTQNYMKVTAISAMSFDALHKALT